MGLFRVATLVVLTAVGLKVLPAWIESPPEMLFHGSTEKGWEPVADTFKKVLQTHLDHGYAFAVYHKGKKVVDLYGGYADYSSLEPYRENTLTTLFSSTKGISALCVAMLADRGLLDYKQKVSHYWPEFAANGKESITVETLLSHQAGLYTLSGGYSLLDIRNNPEKISKQLAEQKPLWEPGTKNAYHGITIAMYMNELLMRVDPKQRTLWDFFQDEFAKPLHLDIHIGLPFSENYRTAKSDQSFLENAEDWHGFFFDNGWWPFVADLVQDITFTKSLQDIKEPFFGMMNNPYTRNVPCGSYSGYGTARSLAKLMGILASGGSYKGKTYISPQTVKLLTQVLTKEVEIMTGNPLIQFGRGTTPYKSPTGSWMFGTPGAGGQMVYGDQENQIGIAFVTNKMYSAFNIHSPQFKLMLHATYDVVKKLK